jgi:uncharacterized membrane protein YgcG
MALLLTAAALAAADTTMPSPGTVNYVEGQVTLNGLTLNESFAGSVGLAANQELDTAQGRAELLLTPGIFLRLGPAGALRMVSPGAPAVAVELLKGEAVMEVDLWAKGSHLTVQMDGSTADITKQGLYVFDADRRGMGVLAGEAAVYQGNAHLTLKKGRGVELSAQPLKAQKLDMYVMENDPLYIWSGMRSAFQAQANIEAAQAVVAGGGGYDAGWFWDGPLDCYAFLPAGGILYSPFGWGFYAPGAVGKAPHRIRYQVPVAGGRGSNRPGNAGSANSGARSGSAHMGGGGGGGHMGGGGGGGHTGGGGSRR